MNALQTYANEILLLMGRSKPLAMRVVAVGILLGFMDLACIILIAKLVAAVTQNSPTTPVFSALPPLTLTQLGIAMIALYLSRALLGVVFHYTLFQRTGRVDADLRASLISAYTNMPYEQRLRRSVGDLANAVNQWTMRFSQTVLTPCLRFICDMVVGCFLLLYFLILYPIPVIGVLVVSVLLGFLYDRTLRRAATRGAATYRQLSEEIAETSHQALAGYKEIRVLGLSSYFHDRIYKRSLVMSHALAISNAIGQSPRLIIEAILITAGILLVLLMGHSGANMAETLPQFAMLTFALLRVSSLVSLATATVANLRLYRGIVAQLAADYLFANTTPDLGSVVKLSTSAFASLEVSSLTFRYEGSARSTIQGTSFSLDAGEAMVIVGESGVGKTTLVDLLLGILKPTSGEIRVTLADGSTQHDFIGIASYLSQTPFVINDTLRRNVALGQSDEAIDDARVIAALKKAKLPAYATSEHLNDMLGDRGAKLSGGQRQRVILARAFYHGHKVMILDEATNAIDLATEIEIVNDLLAMCPEITLITITHRREIARLFPRVLDLSKEARHAA